MMNSTSFSSRLIRQVAFPILIGNLAQNIIIFTDTAFLGHLGAVELGASMMAGLYYYVFSTLAWGFSVGVQIIIARRLGEGRWQRIGIIFHHGLLFVMLLSLLMFSLMHWFSADLLHYVIYSPQIYDSALYFMDFRQYGIFFVCFNYLFRALYVGLSNTKSITYSTILMAVVNIFLDWCLIFGKLGFPEMGVSGAAVASVCAEISAFVFFILFTIIKLPLKQYALFRWHRLEHWVMQTILRLSFPTMLQRLVSIGSWFLFFVMIEKMGEQSIAVSSIIRSVYMLIAIPVFAFATAGNTLVSRIIGEGKPNEVAALIKKVLQNALYLVLPIVLIVVLLPEQVARIYTDDLALATAAVPVVYTIALAALCLTVGFVIFEAVSGTANTLAALLLELIVLLFYVAYTYVAVRILKWEIRWVWAAEIVYGTLLGALSYLYLKYSKWSKKSI